MPELPEVESLRRLLEHRLCGTRVQDARFVAPQILQRREPSEFSAALRGAQIAGVARRGKYLLLRLLLAVPHRTDASEPDGFDLVIHLKMQGWLRIEPTDEPSGKYLCAALELEDGRSLRLYDMWRWAEWWLLPAGTAERAVPGLAEMGLDPFDPRFSADYLAERLARKRGLLKPVLLDQRLVAGLGNLYGDECLHRARLHPARRTQGLKEEELRRLHAAILSVLQEAILQGGARAERAASENTNLDDFGEVYTPQIYDRPGQPCPVCGHGLQKMQLRGRGTTFCPHCQPDAE
jgi:formamidopyrimidine-DNA glycosylase